MTLFGCPSRETKKGIQTRHIQKRNKWDAPLRSIDLSLLAGQRLLHLLSGGDHLPVGFVQHPARDRHPQEIEESEIQPPK